MKKKTKKKLKTALVIMAAIGGTVLLIKKGKKKTADSILSLAQIQKHCDKVSLCEDTEADVALECIDKIYYAVEEILSEYPDDNTYMKDIKRTFGIM